MRDLPEIMRYYDMIQTDHSRFILNKPYEVRRASERNAWTEYYRAAESADSKVSENGGELGEVDARKCSENRIGTAWHSTIASRKARQLALIAGVKTSRWRIGGRLASPD